MIQPFPPLYRAGTVVYIPRIDQITEAIVERVTCKTDGINHYHLQNLMGAYRGDDLCGTYEEALERHREMVAVEERMV